VSDRTDQAPDKPLVWHFHPTHLKEYTMPIFKTTAGAKTSAVSDAIALLTKDHRDVKKLFTAYKKLADSQASVSERQDIATQICEALSAHAKVEEEIFYPALHDAGVNAVDELDEAEVEHGSIKDLVAQIQAMDPDEDLYDAKVKVLGEYVDHHVKEEEGEMFPKAEKSGLDLEELGGQLKTRKEELLEARAH
jgi:hemerythrin superfamily protein